MQMTVESAQWLVDDLCNVKEGMDGLVNKSVNGSGSL